MSKSPQRRAVDNYRSRLTARGMARFEVVGRYDDRELVRAVAKRLAEGGSNAGRLRTAVQRSMGGQPPSKGGVVRALLASPLIGSELGLTRPFEEGRKVRVSLAGLRPTQAANRRPL
jgi:hypothetical protein